MNNDQPPIAPLPVTLPPPCPLLIGTVAVCGSTLRVRWDDEPVGLHGWFCQSCGGFDADPILQEKTDHPKEGEQ